ncbi:unnamed protein product [Cylicocyclus nassatus]|uniref:Uncharacterized protein n=1 Tax=Cylicocyclus nassatus TaxID=53992 RepID=A0AA36HD01_CYLNA|nr:unnamed protein product [Cylicocyclus nassatus]
MSSAGCEVSIDIPSWVPAAIAFGLAVILTIGVCIAYIFREIERHKTFYGKEDKLSSREVTDAKKKEEMDAYALGRCSHEVLVIKSPPQTTPGTAKGAAPSGVKVMLRKKRIITTTPSRPVPSLSIPTSMEPTSPYVFNFNILYDKTGRAFELIDLIQKEEPPIASRSKQIDWLLQQIQTRLEKMTDHNYIVYGSVDGKIWSVKGLENLQQNVEETHLEMRLSVESMGLRILAYKIQAISAEQAMLMSIRGRTSDMRPEPTQATPGRWLMRGTPDNISHHVTPIPQSHQKSSELLDQERRQAAQIRQAMQSPAPPSISHVKTLSTDRKSLTKHSLMGIPKRAVSHGAKSGGKPQTRSRESKELLYKAKARVETPKKKAAIQSKEGANVRQTSTLPLATARLNVVDTGTTKPVSKAEEVKLSDTMNTQSAIKKPNEKNKNSKEGTSGPITGVRV